MVSKTRKTVGVAQAKPVLAAQVAAIPATTAPQPAATPTAVVASAPLAKPPRPATAKRAPAVRKRSGSTSVTAKPAVKPVAESTTVKLAKTSKAADPAKAAKVVKSAKNVKPARPAKVEKARKAKLVRDSFTIPKPEYLVLEQLKQRAGKLGAPIKKSELLRAGIKALAAMDSSDYLAALAAVPAIKTGRPAKA